MTTYRATILKMADDGKWEEYRTATADNPKDARVQATRYLPMGFGGHKRSERTIKELQEGHVIRTPLGTYDLIMEVVE